MTILCILGVIAIGLIATSLWAWNTAYKIWSHDDNGYSDTIDYILENKEGTK